ncbi:MAG TPA: 3-hydroxyacyl-CoA dehydrogenase family protein [Candidatus Poseidoniaceae archaeon]|nr:3-hydroxyacyl-CoA dehydrogenase family protein [Candidatus Poseidoniaceae archaeon]
MGISKVAVIGAGTMGSGIAQICAQAGWQTVLYDAYPEGLERGMRNIETFWDKGITKGKTTAEEKQLWSQNIRTEENLPEAVKQCDLVIEAVPEMLGLKQKIFQEIEQHCPIHTVFATNTSSLSIAQIAEGMKYPERLIGMHFFNPVPIMKLLELVRHEGTEEATVKLAEAAGIAMGKTTILVNDVPGFATSRLGVVLGNEAIRMLADGVASAKDIDTAMVLGYKHPMGPLALTDLVGLDVRRDILKNLQNSFSDNAYAPHPLLEKLVAENRLGKKTGIGIYDWTGGEANETDMPDF